MEHELIDNILVEGIKVDNIIQIVDKMEILKSPKAKNKIEEQDNYLFNISACILSINWIDVTFLPLC